MQVDILADSDNGVFDYHWRSYQASIEFDKLRDRITIKTPNEIKEFVSVKIQHIHTDSISLKGTESIISGLGQAPESRIIKISFQ